MGRNVVKSQLAVQQFVENSSENAATQATQLCETHSNQIQIAMPEPDSWYELLPFKSAELTLDGLAYRYLDEGEGEPIVMSHGNPTWSFYWRELVSAFRDSHRTIAVDHMGCGRSEKPQSYSYRLSDHIDNLVGKLYRRFRQLVTPIKKPV